MKAANLGGVAGELWRCSTPDHRKVLPDHALRPAGDQFLVTQVESVVEVEQRRHQSDRQTRSEQDSIGLAYYVSKQRAPALLFLRPHSRALADLDLHFDNVLVATQPKACTFVGFESSNQIEHSLWIFDGLASYGE